MTVTLLRTAISWVAPGDRTHRTAPMLVHLPDASPPHRCVAATIIFLVVSGHIPPRCAMARFTARRGALARTGWRDGARVFSRRWESSLPAPVVDFPRKSSAPNVLAEWRLTRPVRQRCEAQIDAMSAGGCPSWCAVLRRVYARLFVPPRRSCTDASRRRCKGRRVGCTAIQRRFHCTACEGSLEPSQVAPLTD